MEWAKLFNGVTHIALLQFLKYSTVLELCFGTLSPVLLRYIIRTEET
jgi:hypothetical protein